MSAPNQVSVEQVRLWLAEVPDPEIPTISVLDLGIVREIEWVDDADPVLQIRISPTYSGCPATEMIASDIEAALHKHGIKSVRLKQQLSPPWTSEWISEEGRRKLEAYGIAPPSSGPKNNPAHCPLCGSNNVIKVSEFGSTPCKSHYKCAECLEPFDYFKCL